jgi:NAD(P)-dependent dehydrogenase (short-subunit alcohol dehydrogenase family)
VPSLSFPNARSVSFPPSKVLRSKAYTSVGVKAVSAVCSAEDGDAIVKAALDEFGTVHVLVANAGLLRDKSFMGMDEAMWDLVIAVHLRGTYKVSASVLLGHQQLIYSAPRLCGRCSRSRSTVVSSLLPRLTVFVRHLTPHTSI